ncbi:MAG: hypothetical protein EZS28_008332, partial [Streblomastix strix]
MKKTSSKKEKMMKMKLMIVMMQNVNCVWNVQHQSKFVIPHYDPQQHHLLTLLLLNSFPYDYSDHAITDHDHLNSSQKIQSRKRAQLHFLFRFLCLHLGTPPTQFTFSFYDKKAKKTQCLVDYTPQRFFEEYINSAMIECNHRAAVVEVEESESEEEEEDFIKIERNQKVKEKEKNEVKLLEGKEKEINQQELKKQQQEKDPLGIIQEVT